MKMSATKKQVRFSETGGRNTSLSETLTSQKIETSHSETSSNNKRKKKKKKTQLQILKAEKKKLKRDLKDTRKGILEDNERKASPDYTPYENRQRLARTTSDNLSKLQQLESKITTKEKANKMKIQRKLHTKLKKRFIRADKQHSRLIEMTSKMERMKLGEEELRAEITRELRESEETLPAVESTIHLPPINMIRANSADWVKLSSSKREASTSDCGIDEDSRPASVLSESAIQLSPSEKRIVADKLSHKYDMTRELRNTIHEHMISRSYSFSYFNIIPPYKRRKPKPQKTKQAFNRMVYEDKIGVVAFSKLYPKKVVLSA
ncbi:uncharacterized protein LOC110041005 [Orbicella faveolata]|uniref:uncharacterized protein LOC110041005 n=1 Tax=Orbicella faveolata TaxID=48498 RepID=UPI0009E4CF3D|nr:uncharacterized protein LOC110041005 [Orbicella faveolata]